MVTSLGARVIGLLSQVAKHLPVQPAICTANISIHQIKIYLIRRIDLIKTTKKA